jgi:membrane-bound ClpP family serine protease
LFNCRVLGGLLIMPLFVLTLLVLVLVVGSVLFRSHRKKSGVVQTNPLNKTAVVDSALNPTGAVLLNGEVWPARAEDNASVEINARVQVISTSDHLLVVRLLD